MRHIPLIVFSVIEFVILVLLVTATPLPQYGNSSSNSKACYTMWGFKEKCSGSTYDARGTDAWLCSQRTNAMTAVIVFTIASIILTFIILVLCLVVLLLGPRHVIIAPALYALLSVLTLLVPWAMTLHVFTTSMCSGYNYSAYKMKSDWHLASGFALLVAAWGLQLLNVLLAVFFFYVAKKK